MADGTIQITVGLDSRKFSKDLRDLRKEVDGMKMNGIGKGAIDASNGVDRLKNSSNKALSVLSSLKNTLIKAFAVGAVIKFGKECLELGSNLAEVQNVVDTAFPTMSSQLDEFAKGAMNSFGLSETMAKQYASTFGAMGQAFGFTEKEAYSMSTALTGLSGDVASFYNISQDMAYTKLKSVFTGETESLKELG